MEQLQPPSRASVTAGTEQVADLWSRFAEERREASAARTFAMDHPRIRQRIYDTYLGGLDPFGWLRARHLRHAPVPRAFEIGCGGGDLAIAMVETGLCGQIDAFDVADGAIAVARSKAAAKGLTGINFTVGDANRLDLPEVSYDLIYVSQSLHHVENLENLFAQSACALVSDGLFFAEDYVGPSRMQYSDAHLELLNELLSSLPPEKRRYKFANGALRERIERTPIEKFLEIDPSEGVRAADIIPVMKKYFDVKVMTLGMSVIYEVLLGTIHNFVDGDPGDDAMIDFMLAYDRVCAAGGLVPPCFACLLGRPKR